MERNETENAIRYDTKNYHIVWSKNPSGYLGYYNMFIFQDGKLFQEKNLAREPNYDDIRFLCEELQKEYDRRQETFLRINCDKIILNQNDIEVEIANIKDYRTITINGVKYSRGYNYGRFTRYLDK